MYTRGKFGIEYTPSKPQPDSSWLGRVVCLALVCGAALLTRSVYVRIRSRPPDDAPVVVAPGDAGEHATSPLQSVSNQLATVSRAAVPRRVPEMSIVTSTVPLSSAQNRPVKIRNLLLRLAEAERKRDVEMAISTIEQIRATPGAADLDDKLAQKLGALNVRRLFVLKSKQWVVDVKVKRGDFASRIAYEHGSTLASLAKLNDGSLDKIRIGQTLSVMNHPRFNLVISRRTRTADLLLNGKFFKRYYLTDAVKGAEGSYETPERFRSFCSEMGVSFSSSDRAELEMLLPKGAAAFIKEI